MQPRHNQHQIPGDLIEGGKPAGLLEQCSRHLGAAGTRTG